MKKLLFSVLCALALSVLIAPAASAQSTSDFWCKYFGICSGTTPTPPPAPPPAPTPPPSGTNPFAGSSLYLNTSYNPARATADQWYREGRTADAQAMEKIAKTPVTKWFSSASGVSSYVGSAASAGKLPVLTIYGVPNRDCGGYSSGGNTPAGYRAFIDQTASAIGSRKAAIVLEPDATASISCLNATALQERYDLLKYAVGKLKSNPNTYVYLDAGNARWYPASTMIDRLKKAGIAGADGFSLNVSNYVTTSETTTYGKSISSGVGGKHFVIDTSRNGKGPYSGTHSGGCPSWADPPGRALGERAGSAPADGSVDAYLWIKYPGEADGCLAPAGRWMPEYALGLAQRASW